MLIHPRSFPGRGSFTTNVHCKENEAGKKYQHDRDKYLLGAFHKKRGRSPSELFYFIHYISESFRMIHCQICENFAVQIDTSFLQFSHQLGVGHSM